MTSVKRFVFLALLSIIGLVAVKIDKDVYITSGLWLISKGFNKLYDMQVELEINARENVNLQKKAIHEFLTSNMGFLGETREVVARQLKPPVITRNDLLKDVLGTLPHKLCEAEPVVDVLQETVLPTMVLFSTRFRLCSDANPLLLHGTIGVPIKDFEGYESLPHLGEAGLNKGKSLIVALHGTAAGPEQLFSGSANDKSYDTPDYHNFLGDALVEKGFVVFAPQLITNARYLPVSGYNSTRNQLHNRLLPFGMTLSGLEVSLISESIEGLLVSKLFSSVLKSGSVGAYGVSLGGEIAFYLASLNPLVQAVVISQWMENRDEKLAGTIDHANWRYQNSSYVYSRGYSLAFNDDVLVDMILPRAVFIEAGLRDGQRAQSAMVVFDSWTRKFADAVRDRSLCFEMADAGHEAIVNNSVRFLEEKLLSDQHESFECVKTQ